MRIFNLLCFLGIIFLGASCSTQKKTIATDYLENVADTSIKDLANLPEPVIQKNDLLSIKVYSTSIDPSVDAPYNLPEQLVNGTSTTAGFLVNANGDIEYPRLGSFRVEGLTKTQLADLIKQKLEGQLNQPTVVVRFLNYRISVLGEVRTPGTFNVPTERVTILEALGLAGDVTEFGKRSNIKILRENNGQRNIGTVDLTSKEMFTSPFYHLQQNDVVIVEQSRQKIRQREQQNTAQQIGIATSIITAVALILNFIK